MNPSSHFLFYSSRIENGTAFLDKEESRHVFSALRTSADDPIMITDGRGAIYECAIQEKTAEGATCAVIKKVPSSAPKKKISLVVGLPEKEAFGELCGNLASLGTSEIIPVECEFCQGRWWKGWETQSVRIVKKMIAGIKQAKSAWLPDCKPPEKLPAALEGCKGSLMLLADENGAPFVDVVDRTKNAAAFSCIIGPPGGFSQKEIESLKASGAVSVSLSKNRLRTELAATLLCGMVAAIQ